MTLLCPSLSHVSSFFVFFVHHLSLDSTASRSILSLTNFSTKRRHAPATTPARPATPRNNHFLIAPSMPSFSHHPSKSSAVDEGLRCPDKFKSQRVSDFMCRRGVCRDIHGYQIFFLCFCLLFPLRSVSTWYLYRLYGFKIHPQAYEIQLQAAAARSRSSTSRQRSAKPQYK